MRIKHRQQTKARYEIRLLVGGNEWQYSCPPTPFKSTLDTLVYLFTFTQTTMR